METINTANGGLPIAVAPAGGGEDGGKLRRRRRIAVAGSCGGGRRRRGRMSNSKKAEPQPIDNQGPQQRAVTKRVTRRRRRTPIFYIRSSFSKQSGLDLHVTISTRLLLIIGPLLPSGTLLLGILGMHLK